MDRFDPFVKYSDIYGDVINWEKDPMNKPQNQNKYFFSDGKTYYEQICKMLKLMSVFKDAFNQIYDNEDEISSAWQNFIDNLSATAIAGEEAGVELTWTDTSVNFAFTIPIAVDVAGISSITFNSDYTMTITLTDGRTYTSTSIRGPQGEQGIQGQQGEQGNQGPPGPGVPQGGTTGQALVKSSNNDYDTKWKTIMNVPSTYTTNHLAMLNSSGQLEDSGKSLADLQELLTAGNGIVISENTIINRFTNLTNVDLDTIRYNCQAYVADTCTNKPTSNGGMLICTMASSNGTYGTQLFITYSTTNQGVYYRRFNGSATPTVWRKLSDCYEAGDTLINGTSTNGFINCPGQIVSTTSIRFTIPLSKPINANSISFSQLVIYVRAQNGSSGSLAIGGINIATNSDYSFTSNINTSGIHINLTTPTLTVTPNTSCSVLIGNMNGVFS